MTHVHHCIGEPEVTHCHHHRTGVTWQPVSLGTGPVVAGCGGGCAGVGWQLVALPEAGSVWAATDEIQCWPFGDNAQRFGDSTWGLGDSTWAYASAGDPWGARAAWAALPYVLPSPLPQHRPSLRPTDPCLAGGEQDGGSVPELSLELPPELEAHVAGTVQALQDDMRRVLERLSELETLTAAQVCAVPRWEPLWRWQGCGSCAGSCHVPVPGQARPQGLAPDPANRQPGVAQVWRDHGAQ